MNVSTKNRVYEDAQIDEHSQTVNIDNYPNAIVMNVTDCELLITKPATNISAMFLTEECSELDMDMFPNVYMLSIQSLRKYDGRRDREHYKYNFKNLEKCKNLKYIRIYNCDIDVNIPDSVEKLELHKRFDNAGIMMSFIKTKIKININNSNNVENLITNLPDVDLTLFPKLISVQLSQEFDYMKYSTIFKQLTNLVFTFRVSTDILLLLDKKCKVIYCGADITKEMLEHKLPYDNDATISKKNIIVHLSNLSDKINIDVIEAIPNNNKLPHYMFTIVNGIATFL